MWTLGRMRQSWVNRESQLTTPDFLWEGVVVICGGGRGVSMKYYYIIGYNVQEYEMKTLSKVVTFHK